MLKHPKGLYILAFTEFWERFSFYGMKSLLILYLTKYHFFQDNIATEYIGNYATLVFALPLMGGYFADKFLGFKKAIIYGGILLIIGHLGMIYEGNQALYENGKLIQDQHAINMLFLSMSLIIVGVGFLKPNISSLVGELYGENDNRRDSGFTLFYMGINAGAMIAAIVCTILGEKYGWGYGFGLAGLGMILGLFTFILGRKHLIGIGEPKNPELLKIKVAGIFNREQLIYLSGFMAVLFCWQFVKNYKLVGGLLIGTTGIIILVITWYMSVKLDKVSRNRMTLLLILFVGAVFFFAFLEQQYMSLTLFTDRMVDRHLFGNEINAGQFLSLGPLFIILLGPLFAGIWIRLNKRKKEPDIPAKFGVGIIFSALSFGVLIIGMKLMGSDSKLNITWLVLFYLLITMGELCVSPVGLSSVTKLSVKSLTGFMMGTWFLATAAAEYLAAVFSKMATIETIGGKIADFKEANLVYQHLFYSMLFIGLGIGIVMIILSPLLNKLAHGVK